MQNKMMSRPNTDGIFLLYTVSEVASIMRVKKGYVYELIYTGKLRAVRLSERRVRVSAGELKRYLEHFEMQEMRSQEEN